MTSLSWRWSLALALGLLVVVILGVRAVAGQPGEEEITPEPFPFSDRYPAEVVLESPEDLAVLIRLRIDVGNVQACPSGGAQVAKVYVNDEERAQLAAEGLDARPVPNESLRAWREYGPGTEGPDAWPTFEAYVARMQAIATAYPDLVRMASIGQSVQGRELWMLKISDNPALEEDEPEFKYTSTMHGNEGVGTELTIRLAELLTSNYGSDPELTALVDEMEIWLLPIHNPDGYVAGSRNNANGVNLNRDYPDRLVDPVDDPTGREPETQAMMYFGYDHRFMMGANYHTGALVVNAPWDAVVDPDNPEWAPDDTIYREYGIGYAQRNLDIWNGPFTDGFTIGWQWYMIDGGMQDWAYHWQGEHHLTIEVSNLQPPPYNQMDAYWDNNREAMVWWMGRALTGVRGLVYDAATMAPLDATVDVVQIGKVVRTDPDVGDYHRLLLPGTYTVTCSAEGYLDQEWSVSVISGTATVQDCALLADVTYGVLAGDSEATGAPGDMVTHTLVLTNVGSSVDTYDLALTPGAWPAVLLDEQVGPLEPFAEGQVRVVVEIPAAPARATLLASDTHTLTVSSVSSPTVGALATGRTNAVVVPGVSLEAGVQEGAGQAGQVVSYTLSLVNSGTYTDSYELALDLNEWETMVAPTQTGALGPGAAVAVVVEVAIPPAAGGRVAGVGADTVRVRATSGLDAAVYDELALVTRRGWQVYLPVIRRE